MVTNSWFHRPLRMKKAAKEQFDRWAEGYDKSILQRLIFTPAHDLIFGELNLDAPCHILDIGCGTCVFGFAIAAQSPSSRIFCMDLSHEMAQRAKLKRDRCRALMDTVGMVKITIADSEHLPYADGSLDYVTCSNSFHHYPRQEKVVREMYRVLKPGGKVIIVDGCRDTLIGRFIYDCIVRILEGHIRHLSSGEFRALLAGCGFGQLRQKTSYRGLPLLLTAATK